MAGTKGKSGGRNKVIPRLIHCLRCGKECFDRTKSSASTQFCSHLCGVRYAAANRTAMPDEKRNCLLCGKDFFQKPYIKQSYCSIGCANKFKNKNRRRTATCFCKACGMLFIPKEASRNQFCGRPCAFRYKNLLSARTRAVEMAKLYKECETCGIVFKGIGKFCGKRCRHLWNEVSYEDKLLDRRERIPVREESATCVQCGQLFSVRVRKPGSSYRYKYCSLKCIKQRDNHRQHGVPPGTLNLLIVKQGYKCALCGYPFGDNILEKPSLDHIIPRSKGGSNDLYNLQAAHMYCNSIKSDRIDICTIKVGA